MRPRAPGGGSSIWLWIVLDWLHFRFSTWFALTDDSKTGNGQVKSELVAAAPTQTMEYQAPMLVPQVSSLFHPCQICHNFFVSCQKFACCCTKNSFLKNYILFAFFFIFIYFFEIFKNLKISNFFLKISKFLKSIPKSLYSGFSQEARIRQQTKFLQVSWPATR